MRASAALSDEQKARLLAHPAVRHLLDSAGVLQVTVDTFRSQPDNRAAAVERLHRLFAKALAPKKKRVATKIPKSAKRRRLAQKKQRSETKSRRSAGRRLREE